MDDDEPATISFAANRERAAADTRVRCPKCNKLIQMRDIKCEHCGINFNGEAWQFSPSSVNRSQNMLRMPYWLIMSVMILTAIYLVFWHKW